MSITVLAGGDHPLLPITLWLHISELRRDPRLTDTVREPRQLLAWLRAAEHGAATWKSSLPVSKLPLCCESSSMREPDSWDQTGTAPPGWCLSPPAEGCGGAHAARLRSRCSILLCGCNSARARLRDTHPPPPPLSLSCRQGEWKREWLHSQHACSHIFLPSPFLLRRFFFCL